MELLLRSKTPMKKEIQMKYVTIISGLKWLGLNWDQGPSENLEKGEYYQSQRQKIYEDYLQS